MANFEFVTEYTTDGKAYKALRSVSEYETVDGYITLDEYYNAMKHAAEKGIQVSGALKFQREPDMAAAGAFLAACAAATAMKAKQTTTLIDGICAKPAYNMNGNIIEGTLQLVVEDGVLTGIIDGQHRLGYIIGIFNSSVKVPTPKNCPSDLVAEYVSTLELSGHTFDEFPEYLQNEIKGLNIHVRFVSKGSDALYRALFISGNSGKAMNDQDLDRAKYLGTPMYDNVIAVQQYISNYKSGAKLSEDVVIEGMPKATKSPFAELSADGCEVMKGYRTKTLVNIIDCALDVDSSLTAMGDIRENVYRQGKTISAELAEQKVTKCATDLAHAAELLGEDFGTHCHLLLGTYRYIKDNKDFYSSVRDNLKAFRSAMTFILRNTCKNYKDSRVELYQATLNNTTQSKVRNLDVAKYLIPAVIKMMEAVKKTEKKRGHELSAKEMDTLAWKIARN